MVFMVIKGMQQSHLGINEQAGGWKAQCVLRNSGHRRYENKYDSTVNNSMCFKY